MDEREFSRRAMACAERLWRISYLILRNPADCDDAVQDALLRAWSHLPTLRDPNLFETWLVRILVNCSRDLLRRRRPETALPDEALLAAAEASDAASEPANPGLRDAISALPMKLRLPLVLHHLEGYSTEECAKMLRLPASTVRGRLHAARRKLREAMEKEDPT